MLSPIHNKYDCNKKLENKEDISRLVTVPVEEDQINTPDCSPGAFIRHYFCNIVLDLNKPIKP